MRRKAGESFLIGAEIEIEILEVSPTRVRLGISAPPQMAISRKEVVLTRSENLTAAQMQAPETIAWLSAELTRSQTKDNVNPLTPANSSPVLRKPTSQKY